MVALTRTSKAAGLLFALVCGAALARQPHLGPPPRDIANCRFAAVGADARFIVAGVMEGDTLSNLQFGGSEPREHNCPRGNRSRIRSARALSAFGNPCNLGF